MEQVKEKTIFLERLEKIKKKSAKVAVVGLGYVGLPHAIHYGQLGFPVTGIDISDWKIRLLEEGKSYIDDIEDHAVNHFIQNNEVTTSFDDITKCDVIVIDVPTPLDQNNQPYMVHLETALEEILSRVQEGQLLVLESTTYPTTTQKYIIDPLEKQGWTIGESIFVVYSPERIDPGNQQYSIHNTPKLVGGYTDQCQQLGTTFYGEQAVSVSSPEVAELSKLYENTFRFVNIALANELHLICSELYLDTKEVLSAAETKPFGFMRFDPAVKIGGHCIGVDPYYLQWYMKQHRLETTMINAASQLDQQMIPHTVSKIYSLMNEQRIPIFDASVAIVGVTYKKNISDTRLSAAPELADALENQGITVTLMDPLTAMCGQRTVLDVDYSKLNDYDLVILLTDHDCLDYQQLSEYSTILFDTKREKFFDRSIECC
ncbi:nucleotide sugar dehydrogenase [Enterococcus hermanniensis]|uniref:UDP-glucose/GDP-mannose dehydrogenase C-terminal domain-containing protein n=1 Tax=Enterococcus hermanniensis TaxID=249189 RepID=A0A1L8TN82_9ENTE|nr:nucleotide sugar dehydrogenase [Enterococcus hermanniensis]OJG45628.1 hypothetical protein RV04_GL001917 [Enterococcus hermanniensis]